MKQNGYIFLVCSVFLCFAGCSKPQKEAQVIKRVDVLFCNYPEIMPDSGCVFDLILKSDASMMDDFFLVDYSENTAFKYWKRQYKNSTILEYRFRDNRNGFNYIIGCGGYEIFHKNLQFYIKWRSFRQALSMEELNDKIIMDDDIGLNTQYLETNLSKETLLKFFHDVRCKVIVKRPKSISVDLDTLNRLIHTNNCEPIFEF